MDITLFGLAQLLADGRLAGVKLWREVDRRGGVIVLVRLSQTDTNGRHIEFAVLPNDLRFIGLEMAAAIDKLSPG